MIWGFDGWRRRVAPAAAPPPFDDAVWARTVTRFGCVARLDASEQARLRALAAEFLAGKSIHGAAGLALDVEMKVAIAVQACILVLELGIAWYDDWVEVIVYPDEFLPQHETVDENGVVHVTREPRSGEAWVHGPVILSWADVTRDGSIDGINVVIHEFAHKLDMRNGDANGFPPLHKDMRRETWSETFAAAYDRFCERVDSGRRTAIDPYAAESPGEFFAVLSEAFFETPDVVHSEFPDVYAQLKQFYRQDPLVRMHGGVTA